MIMNGFETDSLFAKMEMDSRLRGNDNGVVCSYIIRSGMEKKG